MKGKTKTGFEAEVDDKVIDNWEIVELMSEADDGNPGALIKGMKAVLGEKGYEKLKDHVRAESEDGIVHTTQISSEFVSLLQSLSTSKN